MTLYVGATQASATLEDITFTLALAESDGTPFLSETTEPDTAIRIEIVPENNPNGNLPGDLSGTTQNYLVGQEVALDAMVLGPSDAIGDLTFNWKVLGNVLYSYDPTGKASSSVQLATDNGGGDGSGDDTGTSQQEVQFFWVSTTNNTSQQNTVSLTVGGVEAGPYTDSTTFNVEVPTATLLSVTPAKGPALTYYPRSNTELLSFGPISGDAIQMTVSVQNPSNLPAGGQWSFLQLDDTTEYWWITDPQTGILSRYKMTSNGLWGLDTQFPVTKFSIIDQNGQLVNNIMLSPGPTPYTFVDNPTHASTTVYTNLPATSMSDYGIFQTYVIYQPPGSGSSWIPLLDIKWSAGAGASDVSGSWELTNPEPILWWNQPDPTSEPLWVRTNIPGNNVVLG
jgi:hypothetical protein